VTGAPPCSRTGRTRPGKTGSRERRFFLQGKIIDRFTILEKKGRHFAFPAAAELPGGGYLLLYHESPAREPAVFYDPKSALMAATGPTPWEPDTAAARPVPRFPASGYCPSAAPLGNGFLLVSDNSWMVLNWMGEYSVRVIPDHDWVINFRGAYTMVADASPDKLLFGKPRRVEILHYPLLMVYGPPLAEDSRSALCFCDFNAECTDVRDRPWEVIAVRTRDRGETWEMAGRLYFEEEQGDLPRLKSPFAVRTAGGEILCGLLTAPEEVKARRLFFSRSADGGESWSKPRESGIEAENYSMLRLGDGRLLLAVESFGEAPSILAMTSEDDGESWRGQFEIAEPSRGRGWSFPRAIEMENGRVFVSFHGRSEKDMPAIAGALIEI